MFESKTIIDMEKTGNNLRKYANKYGYSVTRTLNVSNSIRLKKMQERTLLYSPLRIGQIDLGRLGYSQNPGDTVVVFMLI